MSSPDSKDMDGLPEDNIEGCPLDFSLVHTSVHSTYIRPFTNIHTPKIRLRLLLLFNDIFLLKAKIFFSCHIPI